MSEIEQRGRSIFSKHELLILAQQQEKTHTIQSFASKSTETTAPPKESIVNEERPQTSIKIEDIHQPKSQTIQLTDAEIRRFHLLKEKFERGEPIDVVFGKQTISFHA